MTTALTAASFLIGIAIHENLWVPVVLLVAVVAFVVGANSNNHND